MRRAVVTFDLCLVTKFGSPNDEVRFALQEPRYRAYGLFEVLDQTWRLELANQERSAFPEAQVPELRHLLFLQK